MCSCPVLIDAQGGPWPLHDVLSSRQAEQEALRQTAPGALMAAAGLAVARLATALAPHARRAVVWAGPGNNGGDGLVAALHLHTSGREVQVRLLADAGRLPPDAARALTQAVSAGVPISVGAGTTPADRQADALTIDALLGLGATRAPEGDFAAAIAQMNAGPRGKRAPLLAVDIPSGLHPDTGALTGTCAVEATATLALLTLKPGCFTAQGRDHAGDVWLDTLGVAGGKASAWLSGAPDLQPRRHGSHKGSHGDVVVVGGAPGMVGAAWLAARAALAMGAGRVYCSPLDDGACLLDAAQPALMGRHGWWRSTPAVLAGATVACGCGGGEAVGAALPALLAHVRRLVLDADALNAIAGDPQLQLLLQRRAGRGLHTVLTPHPLEAARLLQTDTAAVQHDRLACASELASRLGSTVVLKGSGSVIVAPGRRPRINPTGNAALASAGTGDVLSGAMAGLWAQQPEVSGLDVAAAAAWQHGRAADRHAAARRGAPLVATALIEALALREFD